MNQNDQYLQTSYNSEKGESLYCPPSGECGVYAVEDRPARKTASERGPGILSRVIRWTFGIIVGATVLFGCLIFWVWGLDYLGVIDYNTASVGKNEFNQDSDEYNEYEDFYNYFDDFFDGGNNFGGFVVPDMPGGDQDSTAPQSGTPGIGVTIQEVPELEFAIDDKYTAGLAVAEINPDGALAGKDINVGDLIVAANGEPCPNIDALDKQLQKTGVGGEMTLTVARYVTGVATTFEVTITLIDLNTLN